MENGCVHQPSIKRCSEGVPASIMIIDHGSTQTSTETTNPGPSGPGNKRPGNNIDPINNSRAIAVHNMTTQLIDYYLSTS